MKLEDLGYTAELEEYRIQQNLLNFNVGRVISEHRERYIVRTDKSEFEAEITGNLRYSANSGDHFPAVGDWVALSEYDGAKAIIHSVFPRRTILERQAVGKFGEKQIIATNVDYAIIVQAVDRDFNLNRIERYLTICHASGVNPVVVLSKVDLVDDTDLKGSKVDLVDDTHLRDLLGKIKDRVGTVPVFPVSNHTLSGYPEFQRIIEKGKTYCLLGSSGVGKSTLINNMLGESRLKTDSISKSSNRGKHITTRRELVITPGGGILIDNPGMREIGITDLQAGIKDAFSSILLLSGQCKFKDCTHIHEAGCAVLEAVEKGEIVRASYENFMKLERETEHFESTVFEKRRKDKEFGKMVKRFKNDKFYPGK